MQNSKHEQCIATSEAEAKRVGNNGMHHNALSLITIKINITWYVQMMTNTREDHAVTS
jgi:hypothetical protein